MSLLGTNTTTYRTPIGPNTPSTKNEQIEALFARFTSSLGFQTALDLGCDDGMTSIQLAKQMRQVTGIDKSQQNIGLARMRAFDLGLDHRTNFVVGDELDEQLLSNFRADVAIFDPRHVKHNRYNMGIQYPQGFASTVKNLIFDGYGSIAASRAAKNIIVRCPISIDMSMLEPLGPCLIQNVICENARELSHRNAYFIKDMKETTEVDSRIEL